MQISSTKNTALRLTLAALACVLAASLLSACATASTQTAIDLEPVTVTRVIDGDTAVVVLPDGAEERVRFIGVDTPEDTTLKEPYGAEATAYARNALEGKRVWLEYDVELRDKYDRVLAYVWLEQPAAVTDAEVRAKMFNARLLLDGYGQLLTIPPDVAYVDYFIDYEAEARDANLGLWSPSLAEESAPEPPAEAAPAPAPAPEPESAPAPAAPSAIDWSQASSHVGERVTIQGPVAGTYFASGTSGQPTFINLGRDHPDPARLTVLIWGDDRGRWPSAPESMYAGKTIRVTGTVEMYEGAAEIIVSDPGAIAVVE